MKTFKRRRLAGTDFNFSKSTNIYINESHPAPVYNLFKKARTLKTKGFKFVWIKDDRVLVRKAEGEKVLQIKDLAHIDTIIAENQLIRQNDL